MVQKCDPQVWAQTTVSMEQMEEQEWRSRLIAACQDERGLIERLNEHLAEKSRLTVGSNMFAPSSQLSSHWWHQLSPFIQDILRVSRLFSTHATCLDKSVK